jgi:hypothetical protein
MFALQMLRPWFGAWLEAACCTVATTWERGLSAVLWATDADRATSFCGSKLASVLQLKWGCPCCGCLQVQHHNLGVGCACP